MCIAILNQKGTISLKTFKRCWNANPDGAGFTYFDGKNIQIIKEMKDVKLLHDKYVKVRQKYPAVDIAIHFRIATHGKVNLTNCHPFKISDISAFIHNGMIDAVDKHHDYSDTYLFNETILKQLPGNFIENTAIHELLSNFIGYSKLVIISGKQSAIINEHFGTWDGGNWYSNQSYKPAPKSTGIVYSSPKYSRPYSWDTWEDSWNDYYQKADKQTKKYEAQEICDCCLNEAKIQYRPEWSAYMCKDCLDSFKDY